MMRRRNATRKLKRVALTAGTILALFVVTPALAQPLNVNLDAVMTGAGPINIENVVDGLEHPWGMTFLPDGRILVTERPGNLRIVGTDGMLSPPLEGTPNIYAEGQGGLLDVALDPNYEENNLVYLSFSAAGPEASAATALGRGELVEGDNGTARIEGFEVIFRQEPWITGPGHFGSRIVFTPEGNLFLTLGERFQFDPAQDLSNHLGTIVRLNPDGSVPEGNPFVDQEEALPEIWSYGHRNIQAAALHPETGALWVAEMGPLGGDELNLPEAGKNYGWPVVSWGVNYEGSDIPNPPTHPEFVDAIKYWSPVIAPSGMIFYTGDVFPEWQGNALIGGLVAQGVVRLELDGDSVTGEELIPLGVRVRDVEQGPDGFIYVLVDQEDGNVSRLVPFQ